MLQVTRTFRRPNFGLNSPGQGMCEVSGIGFTDLENTRTISAGSLTLHYWNELVAPAMTILDDACIRCRYAFSKLMLPAAVQVGSVLQVGAELVTVREISADAMQLTVQRGALGTDPSRICRVPRFGNSSVKPLSCHFYGGFLAHRPVGATARY